MLSEFNVNESGNPDIAALLYLIGMVLPEYSINPVCPVGTV
jgi:hypothetical protein